MIIEVPPTSAHKRQRALIGLAEAFPGLKVEVKENMSCPQPVVLNISIPSSHPAGGDARERAARVEETETPGEITLRGMIQSKARVLFEYTRQFRSQAV